MSVRAILAMNPFYHSDFMKNIMLSSTETADA